MSKCDDCILSGPRMLFEEAEASWTGDEMMMHGTVFYEKHLTFTAVVENFDRKCITITNTGSSVLYYNWELLRSKNTFENISTAKSTKFFFNFCAGVLVPGSRLNLIISFYSRDPGLFNETWQLTTKPVLCGGASLLLRLRGAALAKYDYSNSIADIEKSLQHGQMVHHVRTIIKELLWSINLPTKELVGTEPDVFAQEAKFETINPQLYYHRDFVEDLTEIFKYATNDRAKSTWDFTVDSMEAAIYNISDIKEQQQNIKQVAKFVLMLQHPRLTPLTAGSYHVVYIQWIQTIDKMVEESFNVQSVIEELGQRLAPSSGESTPGKSDKEKTGNKIPKSVKSGFDLDRMLKKKTHNILYLSTFSLLRDMMVTVESILQAMW